MVKQYNVYGAIMMTLYTDGSCLENPGPGGWAVLVTGPDNLHIELMGSDPQTTNNRMELQAAIEALRWVGQHHPKESILLYTDSTYVQLGITQWIHNWIQKGWKTASKQPVKNSDLWIALYRLSQGLNLQWTWVKAHAGHPENELVDQLARQQALHVQQTRKLCD